MNRHERRAIKAMQRSLKQMQRPKRESGDAVPEHPCGHCGQLLDGASSDTGAQAKPGDISVCVACAGINRFRADMSLEGVMMRDLGYLNEEARAGIAAYRTALSRGKAS